MQAIACPQCGQENKIFFIESVYQGPLKCVNCKGLFQVRIEDGKLKSWKPITEEELKAAQELEKLKAKFRRSPTTD